MDEDKREKARAATRKWREANREAVNAAARAAQKAKRAADPEAHRAKVREWRLANKEINDERNRRWRAENREHLNEYRRKQHYRLKYGMTAEQRDQMVADQGGCKICRAQEPGNKYGWAIDHCHATNKVRAVLCHHCNLALGNAKDDPALLRRMAEYLEQ